MEKMKTIRLKRGAEARLASGHLWVFSNELDLSDARLVNGDEVRVESHKGKLLGAGLYSQPSLIAVRLYETSGAPAFDSGFVAKRLSDALELRRRLLGEGAVASRVVFGEADGLPGVVVDRYGEFLSVQFLTQGVELRRELILDELEKLYSPRGIVLRNDSRARTNEGLDQYVLTARGEIPETVNFPYLGLNLTANLTEGQKTGFFFDQRFNYGLLAPVSPGARVLDAFCYSGGWGLNALAQGAKHVTFLDISRDALLLARANAARNGFDSRASFVEEDVLEYLKTSRDPFDLVVLDPPAYVKSKKMLPQAMKGYLNLNKWGMRATARGGYLLTCSCSHHLKLPDFVDLLALAAREAQRRCRVVGVGRQSPDHPWLPSMPETDYLKVLLLKLD